MMINVCLPLWTSLRCLALSFRNVLVSPGKISLQSLVLVLIPNNFLSLTLKLHLCPLDSCFIFISRLLKFLSQKLQKCSVKKCSFWSLVVLKVMLHIQHILCGRIIRSRIALPWYFGDDVDLFSSILKTSHFFVLLCL